MFRALAFLVVLAVMTNASLGQAVYTSQDRWISANDGAGGKIEKSAPDFQPFNETAQVPYAYAMQSSTLEPWQIKAVGYASGNKYNGWCGSGKSNFSATFDLNEPTAWTLSGQLTLASYLSGQGGWSLTGPGVNIVVLHQFTYGQFPLTGSGVLGPGKYVLTAFCSGGCGSSLSGWSKFEFNWSLDLPCQADCDASGSLNIDDFICFQTNFVLGDPTGGADCDGDGSLTIDDFICFQTSFVLGC